jgi:hypothetical protein
MIEREAVLKLIYEHWHTAMELRRQYENDDHLEWAEVETGKAKVLQLLADAVRAL